MKDSDISQTSLEGVRSAIDEVDRQLLELIGQRAKLALQIGKLKSHQKVGTAVYRPEREASIIRKIMKKNSGPLDDKQAVAIFREIISACRSLEKKPRVAFLGPLGTFSEEAALKHFGQSMSAHPSSTIEEVFNLVDGGTCDYGVIPVENSSDGTIGRSVDCFYASQVQIVGELELKVSQCLMSKEKRLEDIATVFAHPQSFAQCRRWLYANARHWQHVECASNAEGAYKARIQEKTAAIGSLRLSRFDGPKNPLRVLAWDVQDHAHNTTRFLVISSHAAEPSGCDKTSILVSASNKPGGLVKLLKTLSKRSINLTHIVSRPAHIGEWEYIFLLDMVGHCQDEDLSLSLGELKQKCAFFKLVGSYPVSIST